MWPPPPYDEPFLRPFFPPGDLRRKPPFDLESGFHAPPPLRQSQDAASFCFRGREHRSFESADSCQVSDLTVLESVIRVGFLPPSHFTVREEQSLTSFYIFLPLFPTGPSLGKSVLMFCTFLPRSCSQAESSLTSLFTEAA